MPCSAAQSSIRTICQLDVVEQYQYQYRRPVFLCVSRHSMAWLTQVRTSSIKDYRKESILRYIDLAIYVIARHCDVSHADIRKLVRKQWH